MLELLGRSLDGKINLDVGWFDIILAEDWYHLSCET